MVSEKADLRHPYLVPLGIPRGLEGKFPLQFLQITNEYDAVLQMGDMSPVCVALFVDCLRQKFGVELRAATNCIKMGGITTCLLADVHHDPLVKAINTFILTRLIRQGDRVLLEDFNPIKGANISKQGVRTNAIAMDTLPTGIFVGRWDMAEQSQHYCYAVIHRNLMFSVGFAAQRLEEKSRSALHPQDRHVPPDVPEHLSSFLRSTWRIVSPELRYAFFENLHIKEASCVEDYKRISETFESTTSCEEMIDQCLLLFMVADYCLSCFLRKSWVERQKHLIMRLNTCVGKPSPRTFLIGGRLHLWQSGTSMLESNLRPYFQTTQNRFLVLGTQDSAPAEQKANPPRYDFEEVEKAYRRIFPAIWKSPLDFTELLINLTIQVDNIRLAVSACSRLSACRKAFNAGIDTCIISP